MKKKIYLLFLVTVLIMVATSSVLAKVVIVDDGGSGTIDSCPHSSTKSAAVNNDTHFTYCTVCKVTLSTKKHDFDSSHKCSVCSRRFNNANDYKGLSYTTHRFNASGKCVVCSTKLEVTGGTYNNFYTWSSYTPYNNEAPYQSTVTLQMNHLPYNIDGTLSSLSITLCCQGFTRCTAAWHKNFAANHPVVKSDAYATQLSIGGMISSNTVNILGVINGTTITFSNLPRGRYKTSFDVNGIALSGLVMRRYADGSAGIKDTDKLKVTVKHFNETTKTVFKTEESSVEKGADFKANAFEGDTLVAVSGSTTLVYNKKVEIETGGKSTSKDSTVTLKDLKKNATITFYYAEPKEEYKVVEKYVYEATNEEIKESVETTVKTGKSYSGEAIPSKIESVDGETKYVYKDTSLNDTDEREYRDGPVYILAIEKDTEIIHWYVEDDSNRQYTVTEYYLEEGTENPLKDPKTSEVEVGDQFNVVNPSISNYDWSKNTRDDRETRITETIITIDGNLVIIHWYRTRDTSTGEGGVVCDPEITSQAMVGSDITLTIPQEGYHGDFPDNGEYYDYNTDNANSKSVIFDFPVYYGSTCYESGEEISLSKDSTSFTFKVPTWAKEGAHTVKVYVSNEEGKSELKNKNDKWNRVLSDPCPVAYDTVNITLYGKIYEFTVTDLHTDTTWANSLFANANDEYPTAKLPIGKVSDKSPSKYPYAIALGSKFEFRVATLGTSNNKINITPKVYFVGKNGGTTTEVTDSINVTYNKQTTNLDKCAYSFSTKLREHTTSNGKAVSKIQAEAAKAVALYGTNVDTLKSIGKLNGLEIADTLKTPYITSPYIAELYKNTGKENDALKAVNHWYGEYSLPSTTKYGTEAGYFIVCFKISSNKYNYENQPGPKIENSSNGVNQWKNEGGAVNELVVTLPSGKNATIPVKDGYYPVAIYDSTRTVSDGFTSEGTH